MKKLKFIPPDYLLIFIGLQVLLHYLFPITKIIFFPYRYIGIFLILVGIFCNNYWVWMTFKKEKTTIKPYEMPSKLVTFGLFKISRNPTYLGMSLTLLGIAILLGSLVTFIFPILFIILTNKFIIPIEEKNLEKKFGKEYINYKERVRRWI